MHGQAFGYLRCAAMIIAPSPALLSLTPFFVTPGCDKGLVVLSPYDQRLANGLKEVITVA